MRLTIRSEGVTPSKGVTHLLQSVIQSCILAYSCNSLRSLTPLGGSVAGFPILPPNSLITDWYVLI